MEVKGMKKIKFIALLVLIALLSACGKNNDNSITTETPTGYPKGEIQTEMIYWNSNLYSVTLSDRIPPHNDLIEIGTVEKIDNENYPDEDFEASRLSVGDIVYKREDDKNLYVKRSDNIYCFFELYHIDE